MEDIKVGDYVRTKQGYIARIIETSPRYIWCDNTIMKNSGIPVYGINIDSEINVIEKHSKNIIDLIEVGDYVNGKKIDAILDGGFKSEGVAERVLCFEIDFPIEKGLRAYHNYDIKSIVTKEQFTNIEYKLNT